MDDIPRMPMLWFEPKISPVCPDFSGPIKEAIYKYYGEDGNTFDREISRLETLRNEICRAPATYEGCALLKRYYAQIYGLVNRFSKEDWRIGVQCVWADIYTGKTTIGDLDLELASVLYNIGVLHIVLGGTKYRKSSDEIKMSCTHFQCAAWAFQHLMDNHKLTRSSDLPDDLLRFYVQISLAQAQVCILEKSMLDKRKPGVVARVASQVVEYYRGALGILEQSAMNTDSVNIVDTCGSKLFRSWKKIAELKIHYYWAVFHYYMGDYAEEQQKMGERVGWYESADYHIKETAKLMKERHCESTESATTMMTELITVKLTNSKKENDFIYHEKVIPAVSMEELKGGPLVKGIPFSVTDPEILVEDIFARLVPIEAHEIASIFSAELDEIRRKFNNKIDSHNNELALYLSALQLDKDSLRTIPKNDIPDELIEICASLSCSKNDLINSVENNLKKLNELCEEIEQILEDSKQKLEEEESKEKEHRELFNVSRPQSLIRVELSKELAKHEETHQKAIESNRSLWDNFDKYKEDIRIMTTSSAAKIESILPSNRDIKFDDEVCNEMERLFDKIDEMKNQRNMLWEKLLKQINDINVLKYAVAHSKSEVETYFKLETDKFQDTIKFLEQNFAAQQNILSAMTKTNARYGDTRKSIMNIQKNRQARISGLIYSREVFDELLINSEKGTEFYLRFKENLTRFNARIRGVCKVQDEERTQMINRGQPAPSGIVLQQPSTQHQQPIVSSQPVPTQIMPNAGLGGHVPSNLGAPIVNSTVPVPGPGAKLKDYLAFMKSKNASDSTSPASVSAGPPSQPTQITSAIPSQNVQFPTPQSSSAQYPQPSYPQYPPAQSFQQPPSQPPLQQQQPTPQPLPTVQPAYPISGPNTSFQNQHNYGQTIPTTSTPQQYVQPSQQHYPPAQHPPVNSQSSAQVTAQNMNYITGTANTYSSLGQPIPSVVPIQQSMGHVQPSSTLSQAPPVSYNGQQAYTQNLQYPNQNYPAYNNQQQPQKPPLQQQQRLPQQPPTSPYHQNPTQVPVPPTNYQPIPTNIYQQPQQVANNYPQTLPYSQGQQQLPQQQLPQQQPQGYNLPTSMNNGTNYQPSISNPGISYQQPQHQPPPATAVQYPPNNGVTMPQQPQQPPAQPINIQQQLENESKVGWAVLTPMKAAEKQLPDILSTMSISGNEEPNAQANNVANNTATVNDGDKGEKTNGQAALDILSEFDPLSN